MIPTYNQAEFIIKAVDSALTQTYENLEVIVGDDASTDETSEIVLKIKHPKLFYVRNNTNLGRVGNYRNLLYSHAKGDYVVNLDGDDYYTDPNFISEAVKLIDDNNTIVMIGAKITRKTNTKESTTKIPKNTSMTGLEILKKLPDEKYYFSHMAVLYHRKKAIELDFYRHNNLSSDWESLYRLALLGIVKYLDRDVGVWRIHGRNESSTVNVDMLFSNLDIWPTIFSEARKSNPSLHTSNTICAKCIAAAAQSSCANISLNGNKFLVRYLSLVASKYTLAFIFMLVTPRYAIRIALAFLGYYRRNISSNHYKHT